MADYISREAAIEVLATVLDDWNAAYATDSMNEIPAADVRPVVRGHWKLDLIYPSGIRRFRCDQCGDLKTIDTSMDRPRANFCSYCGADMREVGEDG